MKISKVAELYLIRLVYGTVPNKKTENGLLQMVLPKMELFMLTPQYLKVTHTRKIFTDNFYCGCRNQCVEEKSLSLNK